jgi:hypothetical protein
MTPSKKDKRPEQGIAVGADRLSGDEIRQHAACRRIIIRLAELGPAFRPDGLPASIQRVMEVYPPYHSQQLEGILKGEAGFDTLASRRFVYGPALSRGSPRLWPVMAFSAEEGCRDLRARVGLFFGDASPPVEDERVSAVAWRFEPPEDSSGSHSYYHAQPISAWTTGFSNLPVALPLNESYPAFPLLADDPLGLLAAVLISLYGRTYVARLLANSDMLQFISPVKAKLWRWIDET